MSNDAIAWAKAQHITSSPQKLLYVLLADRFNDDTGECFPGQQLLADEATMSLSQVKIHLKALERSRFIERTKRFRADGVRTSDAYAFPGYAEWRKDMRKSARDYHETHKKLTTAGNPPAVGSNRDHSRVSIGTTAGNPATNPKKNPKKKESNMSISTKVDTQLDLEEAIEKVSSQVTEAEPAKAKVSRKRSTGNAEFDAFWSAYPRKEGKGPSIKLWAKMSEDDRTAAMRGVPLYKASEKVRKGYVKQGDTYLKDRTWMDFDTSDDQERNTQVKSLALDLAESRSGEMWILNRAKKWWDDIRKVPADIVESAEMLRAGWAQGGAS